MSAVCTARTTVASWRRAVGYATSPQRLRGLRWCDDCRPSARGLVDDLQIAFGFHPREGVPSVDRAKAAIGRHFKTGHRR